MTVVQDEKKCAICGGSGMIEVSQDTRKRCSCSFVKAFRERVGVEIASARAIPSSPLFQPGEPGSPPLVDLTTKNLFIKGWWADIVPHLKYVLIWKNYQYNLHYYTQVITDERLKTIFLGNEAYTVKARGKRDDMETYNTMSDIIGQDRHLVIIQLGFLGHKNVAMPGILKEALMMRQAMGRPTWIVESPDSLFTYGHRAYSDEVAEYIRQRFEPLDLYEDKGNPIEQRNVIGSELASEEGMSVDGDDGEQEPVVSVPSRTKTYQSEEPSGGLGAMLGGNSKKKGKRWTQ